MPIPHVFRTARGVAAAVATLASLALGMGRANAQSLSSGGLTATIVDGRGTAMRDVTVSLERSGIAMHTVTTGRDGIASFNVLAAGAYSVLAEEFGYQPVRMVDVSVVNGGRTQVRITLVRKPPPITSVTEVASNATIVTTSTGLTVSEKDLRLFDRMHDVTSVTERFSAVDAPRDGRHGFAVGGNGLRSDYSTLIVDGVRESLMRHPGIPGEPASAPLFQRDGVEQVTYAEYPSSTAWTTNIGPILNADTRSGGQHFAFNPWATFSSAKLGGRSVDNPGDSAASSFQAGFSMGGPLKADTAAWFIRADIQQMQLPTAAPFEPTVVRSDANTDINAAIVSTANTLAHTDVTPYLAPTVRTQKSGSGSGRLDWRFGQSTLLAVRAGGASWTETNAQVGTEAVNGAVNYLSAQDVSGAMSLTTGGAAWTSDTRIGGHSSKRDWFGSPIAQTTLVGDGVTFGSAFTLPGTFKQTGIDVSETVTARFGAQSLKVGGSLLHRETNYAWIPGSAGRYLFGDLPTFASEHGAFYQASGPATVPDIGTTELAFYIEDTWRATPALNLFAGLRFDRENLPSQLAVLNLGWGRVSGFRNDVVPSDSSKSHDLAPRFGFGWNVSGDGNTMVQGTAGIVSGQFDMASLAEVAQFDGNVTVRRATGALTWPTGGGATAVSAQSLTMFGPQIRKPRAYNAGLTIAQKLDQVTTLSVGGAYRHGDFLLQRNDENRVSGALSTSSEGRPIYGSLQQYGALLTPAVGSNRRFPEFDMVYALTSSGYNDYYEASLVLERRMSRALSLLLSYTWSRMTDDLPGELSADPADRLTPFPNGLNGLRWEDGRSDLDIPGRATALVSYATAGGGVTLSARYRYRAGLPFTPGFRMGVDANGDGSGNNDPAMINSTTSGLPALTAANSCLGSQVGGFAARNSCRDPGVHSLDLRASFALTHAVSLTVDGYNIVGTETGLYDHALVLVDPKSTITTDAAGHTVLPLVGNPGFGTLLSRRGDPRVLRVGIRLEN